MKCMNDIFHNNTVFIIKEYNQISKKQFYLQQNIKNATETVKLTEKVKNSNSFAHKKTLQVALKI